MNHVAGALREHGDELNRTYVYLAERQSTRVERRIAHRIMLARDACWRAAEDVAELAQEVAP
jgi:hypothetical protein